MLYRLQTWKQALTTRPIVALEAAKLYKERGDVAAVESADKVAVVSGWSEGEDQSLSLSTYLQELSAAGYLTIVVSTSGAPGPLQWTHGIPEDTIVLRRRNIGYDFGSWAAVLEALPAVRRASHTLLTNDSMVGPFIPMRELLRRAEEDPAGVVAMTDSKQLGFGIQSYFMVFNGGILDAPEWRSFFRGVREQPTKMDVVHRYEQRVAVTAARGAFGWDVLFPADVIHASIDNPTLAKWKELLDIGYPFAKRTLWTHEDFISEGDRAARYLRARWGVEVEDWLPDSAQETKADRKA